MPRRPAPTAQGDDEGGGSVSRGTRPPADEDDDVFDVAQSSMFQRSVELPLTARKHAVKTTVWDEADVPSPTADGPKGSSSNHQLAMTLVAEDTAEHALTVRDAVQSTWAKANTIQEQAVAAAVRTAATEARKEAEAAKQAALRKLEEELRFEAEKANRRLWELANRERDEAVKAALADQEHEVVRLRTELETQKQRALEELEKAYQGLKIEAARTVQEQQETNINMAVQAAWDRAGRMQETAVAAARKEAKEEAERAAEERLRLERLQVGTDMRKTLQAGVQSHAEEMRKDKAEITLLRSQLEEARATARNAEANAAKQTQQAVKDAMKAMEQVQKAAQDRAVARALAEHAAGAEQVDATPVASEGAA